MMHSGSLLDDLLDLVAACERAGGVEEREIEARRAEREDELEAKLVAPITSKCVELEGDGE